MCELSVNDKGQQSEQDDGVRNRCDDWNICEEKTSAEWNLNGLIFSVVAFVVVDVVVVVVVVVVVLVVRVVVLCVVVVVFAVAVVFVVTLNVEI